MYALFKKKGFRTNPYLSPHSSGFTIKRTSLRENLVFVRGFTIIELLVVMSVMSILFGLGFARYRDFQRRQYVVSAARQVVADLELTKELALSGHKPAGCTELNGFSFYRVGSGAVFYRIDASCTNGDVPYKGNTPMPGGTTLSDFPNPITFFTLAKGTNVALSGTIIDVRGVNSTVSVQILVTQTGEIRWPYIDTN